MKYHIITTQPQIFGSWINSGLIARGVEKGIIKINIVNLYDFGIGARKKIDDTPYGGGAGMVLRVDVIKKAILKLKSKNQNIKTILLTPQGRKLNQKVAKKLTKENEIILISGRFEGFDERIRNLANEEISIGDYILTSGDLPAMVLIDAVSRQIPGFIEKKESIKTESFENNLLEFPQYTRPAEFLNKKVPKILLSGDHSKIALWRDKESLKRTRKRRKDLI